MPSLGSREQRMSLSSHALVALLVGYCAIDRALAPFFTVGHHRRRDRPVGGGVGAGSSSSDDDTRYPQTRGERSNNDSHDHDDQNCRDVTLFAGALLVGAACISVFCAARSPSSTCSRLFQYAAFINIAAAYANLQVHI